MGRDVESRAMNNAAKLSLPNDTSVSDVHAKFVISSSAVRSVRVTDMSSSSGTFVNGSSLPKGKSKQAFVGDKIKVGESLFHIRKV